MLRFDLAWVLLRNIGGASLLGALVAAVHSPTHNWQLVDAGRHGGLLMVCMIICSVLMPDFWFW
jgi:hypothetical protein